MYEPNKHNSSADDTAHAADALEASFDGNIAASKHGKSDSTQSNGGQSTGGFAAASSQADSSSGESKSGDTNTSDGTSIDTLIGRLVIEKGLGTQDEVEACLEEQRERRDPDDPNQRSLTELLVDKGVVTKRQLERIRPEVEERRAGRQIPGYQILSKLGAGAMATVYKARQLSLDRLVAIKILPRKHTNNPDFVRRFYEEGKIAAKLNHRNIVGAVDVGNSGEFHYFVMEYVDGKTVFEVLQEKGIYSEESAIEIGLEMADALSHAHKKGLIHRDVKPKNIMLDKNGVAKLADMGLARAISDVEAAEAEQGKAFGTPYYISPEQVRGELEIDARADLYSLGATIFHMVTGKVPFDGPNPSAVMHKHLKEELVPPDHLNKQLSQGFSEIVEVCMAKDREERYTTADELLEDLQAVAKGEPPIYARRRFDLGSLDALSDTIPSDDENLQRVDGGSLLNEPVFWFGVAGWIIAIALFVIVIASVGG